MPRLLSLFSGTGSLEKPFLEAGWDVQSLDIDGKFGASIVADILEWDYSQEPPCDALWGGCPCEHYSIANTRGRRNLLLADKLVAKTWEIIQHFLGLNPGLLWFIENPDSSWLWKRKVSEPFPHRVRLDFCQYGKPYRKRTKLATNALEYVPRPLCDPRTCPSCVGGVHIKSAQQGPAKKDGVRLPSSVDRCSRNFLHAYPEELCKEIFEHCHQRVWHVL